MPSPVKEKRTTARAARKQGQPVPPGVELSALTPKTQAQKAYIEALQAQQLVVSIGPAGTGKTYVAAGVATDALLAGDVDRILVTRPLVVVEDEDIGFLPGDANEKTRIWAAPVYEAIGDRVGAKTVDAWVRDKKLVFVPLAFMQGLSFGRAFVMLDEAQNTTPGQMKMFLTRIGRDTRAAVDGDLRQRMRREAVVSGLDLLVEFVQGERIPGALVEFGRGDVVRSGLARVAAEVFEDRGY